MHTLFAFYMATAAAAVTGPATTFNRINCSSNYLNVQKIAVHEARQLIRYTGKCSKSICIINVNRHAHFLNNFITNLTLVSLFSLGSHLIIACSHFAWLFVCGE